MNIVIGSTNKAKVLALQEVLQATPGFGGAKVLSVSVPSGVSDQPLSLEETLSGAKNRAKNAFEAAKGCAYGFGLEGGLMVSPGTETGYLHITACAIYSGKYYHIGFSTGFEVPPAILKLLIENKMDLSQACNHSGLSSNANIGSEEGLIGILTKGRMDRKKYCKESIAAALIQLENGELYNYSSKSH